MTGTLTRIFGGGPTALTRGDHDLNRSTALAATTPDAISPVKPPNWQDTNVRTVPIVPRWRSISWSEAEAFKAQAIRRETQSRNWHTAMDAAERIEKADEKDHKRFRGYQGTIAKTELGKLTANSKLAQTLHALRPQYASISHGMESSEIQAGRELTELKNKYTALMY